MRIDVHSHFNPDALVQANLACGGPPPMGPPHPEQLDERIEQMDRAGVDLALLWPNFQPNFPDPSAAADFARLTNDLYRTHMSLHPGRINAWGCLPLPHVDAALAELERCLDELGMAGIGLGCSVLGKPLDDAEFLPVWEELNRRSAVVFIHPGQASAALPGMHEYLLGPCLSSPAEIATAGARLVLSGLTEKFPQVRIILALGGGNLPYASGKLDLVKRKMPASSPLQGNLKQALGRLYYDTAFTDEPVKYAALCELCGADHILYGSDQPFGSMPDIATDIERAACLTPAQRRAILDDNAAHVLGFAASDAISARA